jgi:large subunit ribosomal protein L22
MKALLKNYNQSPRKVRLVADLIRGKSIPAARQALTYLPKKSSPAMLKLLNSAVSNAIQNNGAELETLFVKAIAVNKGQVMRRFMPKARGRAARYAKTFSIVTLELGAHGAAPSVPAKKAAKTEEVKAEKPKAAKKTAAKKTPVKKAGKAKSE